MKNSNDFVNKEFYKDFNEVSVLYKKLLRDLESLKSKKEKIENFGENNPEVLSIKDKINLIKILKELKIENEEGKYLDIDLKELLHKVELNFSDLNEYNKILRDIDDTYEELQKLYGRIILSNFRGESYTQKMCFNNHFIAELEDGELLCLKCGATTKEYDLTKDQLDLLKVVIKRKGMFLGTIRREQIPFIKVIISEQECYKAYRKPLSEFSEEERMDWAEEYHLTDSAELSDIQLEMKKAEILDEMKYAEPNFEGIRPKYLSEDKALLLLDQLRDETTLIKNSNSRFKDLLLEQCKMAKFEIIILTGYNLLDYYNEIDDEDKIAFVKAYNNLSNQNFRINSGYFEIRTDQFNPDFDAVAYECRTMDEEINQKILEMKLNRYKKHQK